MSGMEMRRLNLLGVRLYWMRIKGEAERGMSETRGQTAAEKVRERNKREEGKKQGGKRT